MNRPDVGSRVIKTGKEAHKVQIGRVIRIQTMPQKRLIGGHVAHVVVDRAEVEWESPDRKESRTWVDLALLDVYGEKVIDIDLMEREFNDRKWTARVVKGVLMAVSREGKEFHCDKSGAYVTYRIDRNSVEHRMCMEVMRACEITQADGFDAAGESESKARGGVDDDR